MAQTNITRKKSSIRHVGFVGSQKSLFFQHLGSLQQASLLNASFSGKHGFCNDFDSPKNEPNESNFFFPHNISLRHV